MSIRIIAGQLKGRRLEVPSFAELRPSGDRTRETLFNWLMHDIQGSHCLDLFAGSGALGIEALSRGAKTVTFIEKNTLIFKHLEQTIPSLVNQLAGAAPTVQILAQEALSFLNQTRHLSYDIVFIDPPFQQDLWIDCLQALQQGQWLKPGALVFLEYPKASPLIQALPQNWQVIKSSSLGDVQIALVQQAPQESPS